MKSFKLIGIGTLKHGDKVRFKRRGFKDWIHGEIFYSSEEPTGNSLFILSNDVKAQGRVPKELYDSKTHRQTGYRYSWWYYTPGSVPAFGIEILEKLEKLTIDNYEII